MKQQIASSTNEVHQKKLSLLGIAFLVLPMAYSCSKHNFIPQKSNAKTHVESTPHSKALLHLIDIETRRDATDPFLYSALTSENSAVSEKAAYVVSGMPGSVPLSYLSAALKHKSHVVRNAVAMAISQNIFSAEAREILQNALLTEKNEDSLAVFWEVFGRVASTEDIPRFLNVLNSSQSDSIREGAALGLALFFRTERNFRSLPAPSRLTSDQIDSVLNLISTSSQSTSEFFAQALVSSRPTLSTKQIDAIISKILANPTFDSSRRLLGLFQRIKSESANEAIARLLDATESEGSANSFRIDAIQALVFQDQTEAQVRSFGKILNTGSVTEKVLLLSAAAENKDISRKLLAEIRVSALSVSPSVAGAALKTLSRVESEVSANLLRTDLESQNPFLRSDALSVLATTVIDGEEQLIRLALTDSNPLVQAAAMNSLAQMTEERLKSIEPYLPFVPRFLEFSDTRRVCAAVVLIKNRNLREFESQLRRIATSSELHFVRDCIIDVMEKWGTKSFLAELSALISYPISIIGQKAYDILANAQMLPKFAKVTEYNGFVKPTPTADQIKNAQNTSVSFETTKGLISIDLSDKTPLFSTHFLELVNSNYYNNNRLFRVEPSFVVQFGDPIGDGLSDLGYVMRDELSSLRHKKGSVGVATFGHDGGDAQIFFNTQNNHGLNGSYTVFAEMTSGLEVLTNLSADDYIISAKVSKK